jgi:glycosyltransferase involved in cell wall biosynthesis
LCANHDGPAVILYIHHVGAFSGASKSLVEFAKVYVAQGFVPTVICPRGPVVNFFAKNGFCIVPTVGVSQVDNTRYGHYRGLRWLILLRELLYFPLSLQAIWRARRLGRYRLVHINDATLLPLGVLAKMWLRVPLVVHVRSLQADAAKGRMSRVVNRLLAKYADAVIAIDETVRRTLPADLAVDVVHNGLAVNDRPAAKDKGGFRVGIIGVLLKLKGVYEFAEAARILLKERRIEAEFLIVGENARSMNGIEGWLLSKLDFAHDVRADLDSFIERHGLRSHVKLTGFVGDVQAIYRTLDVLCFPSYLDAAGRPVFEAAFFEVPSIVAVRDPLPDTIVHGETGLCIDGPDPIALADAIEHLYRNPDDRRRMGKNARKLAENNFDVSTNAGKIMSIYERVLAKPTAKLQESMAGPG